MDEGFIKAAVAAVAAPGTMNINNTGPSSPAVIVTPSGWSASSAKKYLDEWRLRPEHRRGVAKVDNVTSLIDFTNRHKDEGSVVFVESEIGDLKAGMTTIFDFHEAGVEKIDDVREPGQCRARKGAFRAFYDFPFSDEMRLWKANDGVMMDQSDFATFMESNMDDVIDPPILTRADGTVDKRIADAEIEKLRLRGDTRIATVEAMVALHRGIEINAAGRAKASYNPQSGERAIVYEETHGGPERIVPPNVFLLSIPVLRDEAPWMIAAHLRYRLKDGGIRWFYNLHRFDRLFRTVVGEAAADVAEKTGLPMFSGRWSAND